MATRHASPNLASQAPKVRVIRAKNSSWGVWVITSRVRVRITPSSAIRVIRRCRRWITMVVIDLIVIRGIIYDLDSRIA